MGKEIHSIGSIYEYDEIFDELIKGFNGTDISFWYYDIINKKIIHGEHSMKLHGFDGIIENVPQSLIECGYVHPDSAEDFLTMHEHLTNGIDRAEGDFWIKPPGAENYWCEHVTYTIISYENGMPSLAMGVGKDVSYEKMISKSDFSSNDNEYDEFINDEDLTLDKFLFMLNTNYKIAKEIINNAINNNEFEIYLQPKIDLKDKKVCGAESLVRWNHPKFGIISPGLFIEKLEEINLIHIVDEFSIREVLKFQKQQSVNGHSVVPVSCNLSSVTLSHNGIAEFICSSIKRMGLSEDVLIIEITETAFVNNNEIIMDNINKLKDFGIKLSMDDFGTGASSLAQLAIMPVDEIKLDIQMVRNAITSNRGNAILLAVIQLANALSLDIVAEGMETFEQVNYVKENGCRVCQCYFFSKPLRVKDFHGYINDGSYREYCVG